MLMLCMSSCYCVKMSTPVRFLLSPKILSPLSPANKGVGKSLAVQKRTVPNWNSGLAKKLEFNIPSIKFTSGNELNSKGGDLLKDGIAYKLDVSNYCESNTNVKASLLVNTPQKVNILENGLNQKSDLNILGRGTFGTVVRGIYKNEDVAVKVVKLDKNKRKLRESNALNLNHENVVKMIDVVLNGQNYAMIIMEYLESSQQLQNILINKALHLTDSTISSFAGDICKGLGYCHEKGILHLDVKPTNILLCKGGVCKLCDFGNCFKINETSEEGYYHQGTVAYTDPEILLGKTPTAKSDAYSFGILLWQIVHRDTPYGSMDRSEIIIYKVVKFGLRPNDCTKELETKFKPIYTMCWSANPGDRPNMKTMINLLEDI